ncbi:triokinase/FMN cyclase-like isoform X2 [Frieseomelitta varia]|uniref:triokinase/FMN cyclase-like isoform X2 n=1 Tax=Frieseomelitta varia TaxID=561572 RepID=UPI001CB683CD|nr:triokinase/FMN cyclase-like isoform X2 [Frieseomelitta varia]
MPGTATNPLANRSYFDAYPTKIAFRTMKSLVNDVKNAVTESLFGMSFAFPQLEYQVSHKVVLMPNLEDRKHKVSLICGGGSGHEPFSAGYVGNGMLAAAVVGSIYAAPPSVHISYAIERVSRYNNTDGVLMIVPNYTGDCLNFGIAIQKASQNGIKIAEVIVNDDCSIPNEEQGAAGKRGLTGIIFVIKIAGALAEKGLPLEDVTKIAHDVLQNTATYSVGLTACAIPGEPLMFELAEDEIEVGQGIHGEAGYEKMKLKPCSEIVAFILKRLRDALSLESGDSVAVIINNFGALSQLEQGIVVHDVVKHLQSMNIEPLRVYAGLLMTSLNSAGVHITLLKLPENQKSLFLGCLDAPTTAPKWPGCVYSVPTERSRKIVQDKVILTTKRIGIEISAELQSLLKQCLKSACESIIQQESHVNDLDRGCGDGDTGSTLKRLAAETLAYLDKFQFSHPSSVFHELADIAEQEMGGASGALYCLFFTSINAELVSATEKDGWPHIWARAFRRGLNHLMKYGKAKPGDRSLIDALNATCETFENNLHKPLAEICDAIRIATWQACESTKNMKPRVGRASYVKQKQYFQNVDAGAYAVAVCVETITNVLKDLKL